MTTYRNIFLALLFGILAPLSVAKERPEHGSSYVYPKGESALESTPVLVLKLWDAQAFERAEISFTATAYQEIVRSSDVDDITVPGQVQAEAEVAEEKWSAAAEVPIAVRKHGEYLIHWTARLISEDETTRTLKGTIAVLAENGRIWFGAGSIDLAYVEFLKNRLGIHGTPRGSALKQLNDQWATWLEERQVRARQNTQENAPRP